MFFLPLKGHPIKIQYWLDEGQSTYKNLSWVILGFFEGLIIFLKEYLGVFQEITPIDMLVEGYLGIFFGSSTYFYAIHEKSFKTSFFTPNVNISVFFQPMKGNPIKIQYWLNEGQTKYKNLSWVILSLL